MRILLIFPLLLASCSYDWIFFWEDDQGVQQESEEEQEQEQEEQESSPKTTKSYKKAPAPAPAPKYSGNDSVELKVTKLWARVDDLENKLKRQREDFHVLRKGLMTGLIPGDWREDLPKYSPSFMDSRTSRLEPGVDKSGTMALLLGEGEGAGGKGYSGLSSKDRQRYERALAKANHHFRSGDYGKAILTYREVGRDYSDKITKGSHLLWIGASWFRLKDYSAARKNLWKLVKQYGASPWVPEAEFLLAKTDFREGFIEKSIGRLKKIIRKYPSENVAERAKEELRRVEESL